MAAPVKEASSAKSKSTPGIEAAKAISLITGVAISPLLGVGAVGAWEYFSAPVEKRGRLPWYARPAFWIPALVLAAMAGAKDIFGAGLPVVLKKPFDVAETIENKISALVMAGAFVPLIANIFPQISEETTLTAARLGFAAIDASSVFNFVLVLGAVGIFLMVWLASHAINILILISPFSTVDAALKISRLTLLGLLTLISFLSPYAGALFAILIIFVSYFIFGWSFRLMIFGNVCVWDFVTLAHRRFRPAPTANGTFTARKIGDVPVRTYGKLLRNQQGELLLEYRPLLLLPRRTLTLPAGNYAMGRGLFYPEIMRVENGTSKSLLTLSPRYRSHEEELAGIYGFEELRDVGLLKGFKAIWGWSKTLIGLAGPRSVDQAAPA